MRLHSHRAAPALLALLPVLLLAACSSSSTSAAGAATSPTAPRTVSPTTAATLPAQTSADCPTRATARGEAWVSGQQVEGSLNGGSTTVLSNFHYPLGITDENAVGNAPSPSFISWSPDGAHLAVAMRQIVPFQSEYTPFVVDTATHVSTMVPLAQPIRASSSEIPKRMLTWADANTLIILGGNGPAFSFDVTSHRLTPLPGISHAVEGVARCTTLFYLEYGPLVTFTAQALAPTAGANRDPLDRGLAAQRNPLSSSTPTATKGPGLLHRYSLTTNADLGSPITLGDVATTPGSEGFMQAMGWDASPDGSHIAYQRTTATVSTSGLVVNSAFFAAKADGSGKTTILPGATADSQTEMAISPDGQRVAVSDANPTPNVLSGDMAGGGRRAYTPDTAGGLAWLADSSGFEATRANALGVSAGIYRFLLSTALDATGRAPGSEVHPGGDFIATLP